MSNMHTPSENALAKQGIAPQAVGTGATVTGNAIDTLGYEAALFVIEAGAISSGANISVTVKLQESSDNGGSDAYADISGATTGAIVNAGQNEPYLIEVNLSEQERYLKPIATGGSSGGGLASVTCILLRGRHNPPTQDNTVVQVGF